MILLHVEWLHTSHDSIMSSTVCCNNQYDSKSVKSVNLFCFSNNLRKTTHNFLNIPEQYKIYPRIFSEYMLLKTCFNFRGLTATFWAKWYEKNLFLTLHTWCCLSMKEVVMCLTELFFYLYNFTYFKNVKAWFLYAHGIFMLMVYNKWWSLAYSR